MVKREKVDAEYLKKLGERIASIRKEKGMTQTALGYACDLERQNMRRIEASSQEVVITPNPATNQIVITSNIPIKNVRVQSITGQVLRIGNCNDVKVTVDLGNLANGIYIVMVDNKPYKVLKQ